MKSDPLLIFIDVFEKTGGSYIYYDPRYIRDFIEYLDKNYKLSVPLRKEVIKMAEKELEYLIKTD